MDGRWHARPVMKGVLKTEDLANHIQKRCTVTLKKRINTLWEGCKYHFFYFGSVGWLGRNQ